MINRSVSPGFSIITGYLCKNNSYYNRLEMFDLDYNNSVPFTPITATVNAKLDEKASSEELQYTDEKVDALSEVVNENKVAIAENKAAIDELRDEIDGGDEPAPSPGPEPEPVEPGDYATEAELTEVANLVNALSGGVVSSLNSVNEQLVNEVSAREEAVNGVSQEVTDAVAAEKAEREEADGAATTAINGVIDALALEVSARENAVSGLTAYVNETFSQKDEVDNAISAIEETLSGKADSSDLQTLSQSVSEKADTTDLEALVVAVGNKADKSELEGLSTEIEAKADEEDLLTLSGAVISTTNVLELAALSGAVEDLVYEFDSVDTKLAGLAIVNGEQDDAIALKADADAVYTKEESDEKFLTEHQDISGLATKEEVAMVNERIDMIEIPDLDGYAQTTAVTAEIAAASAVLAAKDAEQDAAMAEINSGLTELDELKANKTDVAALIASKETEIYNLTKLVGELGGNVTYTFPNELGTSLTELLKNCGTVKLAQDATISRFGPAVTAKNKVTLNLNNHNLTSTAASSYGAIMARGTQEITIGGKGTIDAGDGVCIEANGTAALSPIATINLTGSTTVYRNNRSGGELIYCYVGTINITNGTFRNDGADKTYMLNCYDANYQAGTAKIVVTGGKFYDFNPADNGAEGEHTSFVPEGYHVETSTVVENEVEHTIYTVKKDA